MIENLDNQGRVVDGGGGHQQKDYLKELKKQKEVGDIDSIIVKVPDFKSWNLVSKARLFFIVAQRVNGPAAGLKILLRIEEAIDETRLTIDYPQMKEAFFLLYKARVAAMHSRQEFGYLTLNLKAIHEQFTEIQRGRLFQESREICKAYIAILCLSFRFQRDEEYQVSSSYLQARLDEAVKLNSEVLVQHHLYHKYTPKLKVHQLRIKDSLNHEEYHALDNEIAAEDQSRKYAQALASLKLRKAIQMETSVVMRDFDKAKVLLNSLEGKRSTFQAAEFAIIADFEEANRLPCNLRYSWAFKTRPDSAYLNESQSRAEMSLAMRQEYVKVAIEHILREGTASSRPCFFGFEVLQMAEEVLLDYEQSRMPLPLNPNFKADCQALREHYLQADRSMRLNLGEEYDACYWPYLQGYSKINFERLSYNELKELQSQLEEDYSSLQAKIKAGNLNSTMAPVRFIELTLYKTLASLCQMGEDLIEEANSILEQYLSDFKSSQVFDVNWMAILPEIQIRSPSVSLAVHKKIDELPLGKLPKRTIPNIIAFKKRCYFAHLIKQMDELAVIKNFGQSPTSEVEAECLSIIEAIYQKTIITSMLVDSTGIRLLIENPCVEHLAISNNIDLWTREIELNLKSFYVLNSNVHELEEHLQTTRKKPFARLEELMGKKQVTLDQLLRIGDSYERLLLIVITQWLIAFAPSFDLLNTLTNLLSEEVPREAKEILKLRTGELKEAGRVLGSELQKFESFFKTIQDDVDALRLATSGRKPLKFTEMCLLFMKLLQAMSLYLSLDPANFREADKLAEEASGLFSKWRSDDLQNFQNTLVIDIKWYMHIPPWVDTKVILNLDLPHRDTDWYQAIKTSVERNGKFWGLGTIMVLGITRLVWGRLVRLS